jgi:hypothetical protein
VIRLGFKMKCQRMQVRMTRVLLMISDENNNNY